MLLIGILATWGLGMICQAVGIYHVAPASGFYSLFPDFSLEAFKATFSGFGAVFCAAFDVDSWNCSTTGNSGFALLKSLDFARNPARSCVAVKELPKGVLCEVEVIASL